MSTAVRRTAKSLRLDAACAEAVELARDAALEMAGKDELGPHLGCVADGERVVTHYFANQNAAYQGWRWAVTVARAPRQKHVTVDEVVLLPGDESVLAPAWVPWSERVRPGDLGPGDLLPTTGDDPRLVPGYTEAPADPDEVKRVADELGLGRPRVLSPVGKDDAVFRWYSGDNGPEAPIAQAAPGHCSTCGFIVRMAGELGTVFGVCANEYAPSDGKVVSLDHGCGAHSEAVPYEEPRQPVDLPSHVLDTLGFDDIERL